MGKLRTCFSVLIFAALTHAQTPPAADTLTFTNGEKLIGHFVHAHGSIVTFKSDSVGEVNVDWSKIQELHTSQKVLVIGKDVKLGRHRSDLSKVPQGTMTVAAQTVTLAPESGAPIVIPVPDAAHVVDADAFQRTVIHNPGFLEDWKGAISAGASIVEATQQSRTFTTAINLIRAIPPENWVDARNRTIVNFSASTGLVTQPNTPQLKTEIVHGDFERDEYFKGSAVYGFGQAAFDHNFSQGLNLQQAYGGGIGMTVVKHANTTVDVKGSVTYIRQSFQIASSDHNLIGSIFAENLTHKFGKGILFLEGLSVTPAWNEPHAYSANANAALTLPVYKRFAFSISMGYVPERSAAGI